MVHADRRRSVLRLSNDWNAEQRDCAGLVRFAWREALRRHDRPWFQKMGPGYKAIAPDVKRYRLEQGPLGEKLFRTNFGAYKEGDLSNGTFSEFADARTSQELQHEIHQPRSSAGATGRSAFLLSTMGTEISVSRDGFSRQLQSSATSNQTTGWFITPAHRQPMKAQ